MDFLSTFEKEKKNSAVAARNSNIILGLVILVKEFKMKSRVLDDDDDVEHFFAQWKNNFEWKNNFDRHFCENHRVKEPMRRAGLGQLFAAIRGPH